jgi:hypothetical protein
MYFINIVGQVTTSPIFESMNGATAALDQGSVLINHRGDLLTLIRMNKKNDLIMSH